MIRFIYTTLILIGLHSAVQAQHFDPLYENNFEVNFEKTWEDSGYYFIPTLVRFQIVDIVPSSGNISGIVVQFRSTDASSIMFSGQASLFYRTQDVPGVINIDISIDGLAWIIFPKAYCSVLHPNKNKDLAKMIPISPSILLGDSIK